MNHSTETRTQKMTHEPLPTYNPNGEDATPSSDLKPAGPEPRPVTAATARHRLLWEEGTLVLVGEDDSFVVGPIGEDLTTESIHSIPRRESQQFKLSRVRSSCSSPPPPTREAPNSLPFGSTGGELWYEFGRTPRPAMEVSTECLRRLSVSRIRLARTSID